MPTPVTRPKLVLIRKRDEEDLRTEAPSEMVKGLRKGAFTLACVPDILHPYVENEDWTIPPELSDWRGVIERHRHMASKGLIDFSYTYKVDVVEAKEMDKHSLADLGRNLGTRLSGLRSPVDGYTRTSEGILDGAGRLQRQLDIFGSGYPAPEARKLVLKPKTARLRED